MNRNNATYIVAACIVAALAIGYYAYREHQKNTVEINIGESSISIEKQ